MEFLHAVLHRLPYCTHAWQNGVCKGSPLFRPMPYGNPTHSLVQRVARGQWGGLTNRNICNVTHAMTDGQTDEKLENITLTPLRKKN